MSRHGGHGRKKDNIHVTPDVSHIQNPEVSHEASDVNIKSIVIFAVGLVVLAIIVHVLMLFMYKVLDAREQQKEGQRPPMALTEKERLPPEPRLQAAPGFGADVEKSEINELRERGFVVDDKGRVNLERREPQAEMKVVREQWKRELDGGVPDPLTGQNRIPIEQAEQMLLQKGLPTRQAAQGGQNLDERGMDIPSFWSSGQQTEKREQ